MIIYGNIYHQSTPNVGIYTSTMDPMGNEINLGPFGDDSPKPLRPLTQAARERPVAGCNCISTSSSIWASGNEKTPCL